MKTVDVFGVLRPSLGQVKNCPIFQGSELPVNPPAAPAPAAPEAPADVTPVSKGVALTAAVENEKGETPRGILLYPGAAPAYLVAEAFGIRAGAPAQAFSPDGLSGFSIPMMMTDESAAEIKSTLASIPAGYAKKVWFWKIDRSPLTFSIPAEEMVDVDGTPLAGIAFKFPPTGSFMVSPDAVVLRDGDRVDMDFSVRTVTQLGRRYKVQNL